MLDQLRFSAGMLGGSVWSIGEPLSSWAHVRICCHGHECGEGAQFEKQDHGPTP